MDVDAYVAEAPEDRRVALAALRDACREELAGFAETMAYRMPSFQRDGEVEVAFASQKGPIALYVLRTDVLAGHRVQLAHVSVGKGAIRYRRPEDVDLDVVRSMLRATGEARGPIC